MTLRTRLIGAAALLSLTIAGSGCNLEGPSPPPPPQPTPQSFTLSGTVTEATPEGHVPIEGVTIGGLRCPAAGPGVLAQVSTDDDGRYTFPDMCAGLAVFWTFKAGYRDKDETLPLCEGSPCYKVTAFADTRFDVELVRLSGPLQGAPLTFTLSGTVTEATPAGNVPIEGVTIEALACPATRTTRTVFTLASTDSDGRYSVPGMCSGATFLWVYKEGYRDKDEKLRLCDGYPCYEMTILGDTRFDVELVRLSEPSASSLASTARSRR